jgi:hypothetical protein
LGPEKPTAFLFAWSIVNRPGSGRGLGSVLGLVLVVLLAVWLLGGLQLNHA